MSYNAAMPASSTLVRLGTIAEDQWGLVTRRQAQNAGVSPATVTRLIRAGVLDPVAHGVYRLAGSPSVEHTELRAAWLQLAPETPAWNRPPAQGVVSHRSAAALYGIGDLPADTHEFTLPVRRQTRRRDVRLHVGKLGDAEWVMLRGVPVTRPARIAADLMIEREDPEAIAQVVVDAIRDFDDHPRTIAIGLARHAGRLGLRRGDGEGALRWLLDLVGDSESPRWLAEATGGDSAAAGVHV